MTQRVGKLKGICHMHSTNDLYNIYIAGLLHDLGKYIQKYSKSNFKHHTASQLFILQNPQICCGADYELIASVVAHHHRDRGVITVGDTLSPTQTVSAELMKKAEQNYNKTDERLNKILQLADQFSASSDRASELVNGQKGGRAPYAPLISTIGQACGTRLAVRHGKGYEVYEYTGEDEQDSTIETLDPGYKDKIAASYTSFMDDLQEVRDVQSLDQLLKYYWQNVNANTWKPAGEKLGNTTTSLYDHAKTTAAIAACIYINAENGYALPAFSDERAQISLMHIMIHGCKLSEHLPVLLKTAALETPNIITQTESETYLMVPNSMLPDLKTKIQQLNESLYTTIGGTIDVEIAPDWRFRNCRDPFTERFTEHESGILQIITTVVPALTSTYHGYRNQDLNKHTICGYIINQFDMIINYSSDSDSISKVTTTMRIFEQFEAAVVTYLAAQKCIVLKAELSKCIYAVPADVDIHKIEYGIYQIFLKYTQGSTGLTFIDRSYDRYSDVQATVENELAIKKRSLTPENATTTTVKIRCRRMPISSLNVYNTVLKQVRDLHKGTVHKLILLYSDALQYPLDHDTKHLMAVSRLYRLISQTKRTDDNQADLDFMQQCLDTMYNSEKGVITARAGIYYEALKTFVSEKGDYND